MVFAIIKFSLSFEPYVLLFHGATLHRKTRDHRREKQEGS